MDDMGTIECKTPSNRGDNILVSATAFDVTKVRTFIMVSSLLQLCRSGGRGSWDWSNRTGDWSCLQGVQLESPLQGLLITIFILNGKGKSFNRGFSIFHSGTYPEESKHFWTKVGNLIPEVESNLLGQAGTNFESNQQFQLHTIFTKTIRTKNHKKIIMADVPAGARRIIFVAISDIEGESQWGAQYDASPPPQPARETIWKCLHSSGNHSKKSK